MVHLVAFAIGAVTAVMMAVNGGLTESAGPFSSALIVHIVGTVFSLLVLIVQRRKILPGKKLPLWLYLAGVIGITTTLFNNYSFLHISLTAIVALSLLGQTLTSLFIDYFGWFRMPKHPPTAGTLAGLLIALPGIVMMLAGSGGRSFTAYLLSFLTGLSVVTTRHINADLAAEIGAMTGSFYNHLTGLVTMTAVFLFMAKGEPFRQGVLPAVSPWLYTGGMIGVLVIVAMNLVVPKIKAVDMTLLSVVGQLLAGAAIDLILDRPFAPASFYGGLIIGAGVVVSVLVDYQKERRRARRTLLSEVPGRDLLSDPDGRTDAEEQE